MPRGENEFEAVLREASGQDGAREICACGWDGGGGKVAWCVCGGGGQIRGRDVGKRLVVDGAAEGT